ncbi:MAG TPA: lipocalin family protein [Anaerolineales bacterium]|nr:lipocalin family protein [Anaerolineales bacterium]HLO27765.1 lipocalin family protein [Anaerolineales bacterium]
MNTRKIFSILLLLTLLLTSCAPKLVPTIVGTWTSTVTKEDILRVIPGFDQQYLCESTGTFLWKFNADGTFTIDQTQLPDCPAPANPHIEDKWSADGNVITFAAGTPDQETYEITINGDQLIFKTKSSDCVPCIAVNTANPWKRVK